MTSALTVSASLSARSMRHPSSALNEQRVQREPEAEVEKDHRCEERDRSFGDEWVVVRRWVCHETCCPSAVRPPRSLDDCAPPVSTNDRMSITRIAKTAGVVKRTLPRQCCAEIAAEHRVATDVGRLPRREERHRPLD